jgi:hypothetical protein
VPPRELPDSGTGRLDRRKPSPTSIITVCNFSVIALIALRLVEKVLLHGVIGTSII